MIKFRVGRLLAGISAAGVLLAVAPANAASMQAVFSGQVSSGTDDTNYFGQGASLNGLSATLTFIFDPATPTAQRSQDPSNDTAYGGTLFGIGIASPIQSAVLNIGGVTHAVDTNQYGGITAIGGTYFNQVAQDRFDDSVTFSRYNFVQGIAFDPGILPDLDRSFELLLAPLMTNGQFQFANYDYTLGQYQYNTKGNFQFDHLQVTNLSAVPLPAALPLLASALAGAGLITRRRKAARADA